MLEGAPSRAAGRPAASTVQPSGYKPHLDALRAYAVLLVIVAHTYPRVWPANGQLLPSMFGGAGVRLFFVLSGFLITQILWDARDKAPTWQVLRSFYIRRALRIFPLAFLVLGIVYLMGRLPHPAFYFLYLSNWLALAPPSPDFFGVEHYWSLAVEEQFYLAWPLLILFLPRRAVLPTATVTIGVSLALVLACLLRGDPEWAYKLTPTRWSALAAGGAMALGASEAWIGRASPWAVATFGLLWWAPGTWWANGLSELSGIVVSMWLVRTAARGWPSWVARWIAAPPVLALGRIAYGMYVYHFFLVCTIPYLESRYAIGLGFPDQLGHARFAYTFALTTVVATASWLWFERPVVRLKRLFPYARL